MNTEQLSFMDRARITDKASFELAQAEYCTAIIDGKSGAQALRSFITQCQLIVTRAYDLDMRDNKIAKYIDDLFSGAITNTHRLQIISDCIREHQYHGYEYYHLPTIDRVIVGAMEQLAHDNKQDGITA